MWSTENVEERRVCSRCDRCDLVGLRRPCFSLAVAVSCDLTEALLPGKRMTDARRIIQSPVGNWCNRKSLAVGFYSSFASFCVFCPWTDFIEQLHMSLCLIYPRRMHGMFWRVFSAARCGILKRRMFIGVLGPQRSPELPCPPEPSFLFLC